MAWQTLERDLFARARHGMKLGLDRMQRALAGLGHPERAWPSVHVAGTNGKGSTCAFTERLFREAGLKTGLYTSPHLERFGERIRVSGVEVDEATLESLHEELSRRIPWAMEGPEALTFFELVTLLGFLHFAREQVDVVVAEVGLGGRLDATNVLSPVACAITPIGLDHAEYLGSTLAAIATEKAGILKPGVPCVVARQPDEALVAIRDVAIKTGAVLELAGEDFAAEEHRTLGLEGPHQRANAALAVRLFEHACRAGISVRDEETVRRALSNTRWPGRFERVRHHPELVIDGAHNPEGARALASAIEQAFPGRRVTLVVGVLADKSPEPMLDTLAPLADTLLITAPDSPRALAAEKLAELAKRRHARVVVEPDGCRALEQALSMTASDGVVIACGSLYLVGQWRAWLGGGRAGGPREQLAPAD